MRARRVEFVAHPQIETQWVRCDEGRNPPMSIPNSTDCGGNDTSIQSPTAASRSIGKELEHKHERSSRDQHPF